MRDAILRELDRGGQVFYVHNRVRGINIVAEQLRKLVPEANIGVGHGQMEEAQLEAVMIEFAAGKYDVLVCTTIIESGIDIPNANTLVVAHADKFGLAQLYQLRGRVGTQCRARVRVFFAREKSSALCGGARPFAGNCRSERTGRGFSNCDARFGDSRRGRNFGCAAIGTHRRGRFRFVLSLAGKRN